MRDKKLKQDYSTPLKGIVICHEQINPIALPHYITLKEIYALVQEYINKMATLMAI